MTRLNRLTIDRLKQLPRLASVWEGDRRSVNGFMDDEWGNPAQPDEGENSDCILWVDSSHGTVRGITIVPSSSGYEPVVRTLLQAIEAPQGGLSPARPKKIVVRDREIQFYLRGALQGLDIAIDYAPELPLIDELFHALLQSNEMVEAELPERYGDAMVDKAMDIWELAPWHSLNEQQILAVELNAWEVDTLYVSVLGMGGVEYGLLMYRSLDSLKQFRDRVLMGQQSPKQMQEAFLEQDCLFLNFELFDDEPPIAHQPQPPAWLSLAPESIEPEFGSIHPLEGLRNQLADEEGATFLVAMEAIKRFFGKYRTQLEKPPYKPLTGRYRIPNPESSGSATLSVTVKTLPEVTEELAAQTDLAMTEGTPAMADFPILRDDYVPDGALIVLTQLKPDWLEDLHQNKTMTYQGLGSKVWQGRSPLPAVLIQTSRPKAKTLIHQLQAAQGVQAVCFNPGSDPFSGDAFHLGLLQTGDGELHLFAEYETQTSPDRDLLERWQRWQSESEGTCAVVIASGVTGKTKGRPCPKDVVGVFEARCRTPQDLQLPPLMLQYAADWDMD
jgi:hypothetical protein